MNRTQTLAMSEDVLGYRVYGGNLQQCVKDVASAISLGQKCWLACLNPHSYAVSRERPRFSAALTAANWLVPDGIGVVMASRVLGGSLQGRITGSDVFRSLHDRLDQNGGARVFLLGSTEATLGDMAIRMAREWPSVRVVGSYAPPFRDEFTLEDRRKIVAIVNEYSPDILWVGLSAPKQEELIHQILPDLNVRFVAAIGAVFDFYTGRVRRSHPVMQRMGLEWLPRLIQQPRRLWRRMFISAPVFVWHVLRRRFGHPL